MSVRIVRAGLLTTVQDLGRFGYAHIGMSPAGAADALSFRVANVLVGNDANAPALEMTLLGPTVEFEHETTVAFTGASIADANIPMWQAVNVPAGYRVSCGALTEGARAYLAIGGGFDVPRQMQSASTHLASFVGGLEGRALRDGDVFEAGSSPHVRARKVRSHSRELFTKRLFDRAQPIRVTRGVQWDWYDSATVERFATSVYAVSEQSNRVGLRLTGASVAARNDRELLTEGVALGAIQTPPDGQPIILFVDQQTTGGYPKIANVIAADLPRIGQLRPRDEVRFQFMSFDEALSALRAQEMMLQEAFE